MWLACISAIAAFNIQPPIKNGTRAFPSGKMRDGWITCVSSTLYAIPAILTTCTRFFKAPRAL